MRFLIAAFLALLGLCCAHGNVHAGLIGQSIQVEFVPGVDYPGQHQSFTGVVPKSFTFNFPVYAVNYGNLFTVSVTDSTIAITDINSQVFIWEPGDKFVFTILGGGQPIANASLLSSTFPGFTSSNVGYTGNSITLTTPPGAQLHQGNSLTLQVQTIPEPASLILWCAVSAGIGGLVFRSRRKKEALHV